MGLNWIPANLFLFFLLSLIGYAVFDRRWKLFWVNLGFTGPEAKNVLLAIAGGLLFSLVVLTPFLWQVELSGNDSMMAYENFVGIGLTPVTLAAAFAWAFLHQGLPEELFFRGFLLGQLTRKISLFYANMIQAMVFWLMHIPGYMYLWAVAGSGVEKLLVAGIALVSLCASFIFGWLRIRDKNRSLVGPAVMHTLANGITYSMVMLFS